MSGRGKGGRGLGPDYDGLRERAERFAKPSEAAALSAQDSKANGDSQLPTCVSDAYLVLMEAAGHPAPSRHRAAAGSGRGQARPPLATQVRSLYLLRDGDCESFNQHRECSTDGVLPSLAQLTRRLLLPDFEFKSSHSKKQQDLPAAVALSNEERAEVAAAEEQECGDGYGILGGGFFRRYAFFPLAVWDSGQQGLMLEEHSGGVVGFDLELRDPGFTGVQAHSLAHLIAEQLKETIEEKSKETSAQRPSEWHVVALSNLERHLACFPSSARTSDAARRFLAAVYVQTNAYFGRHDNFDNDEEKEEDQEEEEEKTEQDK